MWVNVEQQPLFAMDNTVEVVVCRGPDPADGEARQTDCTHQSFTRKVLRTILLNAWTEQNSEKHLKSCNVSTVYGISNNMYK